MTNRQVAIYTTTRPLGANGFYSPLVWENALEYATYGITYIADRDSTITVQFSNDRFNITFQQLFYVLANETFNFTDIVPSAYFRLRVDNQEATAMTLLSLSTYLKNDSKNTNVLNANLWLNAATGVGGVSALINSNFNIHNYTFFGTVNGTTNLVVQMSNDGNTWYSTQYTYTASGAGSFGFNVNLVAQYVRLVSSANIVATIQCNAN
jgi:hypothetical protein